MKMEEKIGPAIPHYLQSTYWWAYLHPRAVRFFERQWIVNCILWGNFKRLTENALDEIGKRIKGKTAQIACVYGDFTESMCSRLDKEAQIEVVDVAPIQLENLQNKLSCKDQIILHRQNAEYLSFDNQSFDNVILFFLLHEVPAKARNRIINEALRIKKPQGRLVVVDYHKPAWYNPIRLVMWPILKLLEPYALDLWHIDLQEQIGCLDQAKRIKKKTCFGGLYQILTID